MNKIILKTGESYQVSDEALAKYQHAFTEYGQFRIQGNLVTKQDKPVFSKQKSPFLMLAEHVFTEPAHIAAYKMRILVRHGNYVRRHGSQQRIHYSLISAVREFVSTTMDVAHHYDADLVFDLIEANYECLQKMNIAPQDVLLTDLEVLSPMARSEVTLAGPYYRKELVSSHFVFPKNSYGSY